MTEQSIGPYRVVRKLGEGGMGVVFEAVHENIERRVAIKVLRPEYCRNAEIAARFANEARAVNRVTHLGLVEIYDYGHLADGTAYLVMELLHGETLASRLRRAGPRLSIDEVLRLGLLIAESLVAAHEKGVVHRDLKPDNVMLVPDLPLRGGERTKLLDFGIAKLTDDTPGQHMTAVHAFMGTPAYMSPEQCLDAGQVDGQADVYSLGVMLYEMLAGGVPFGGTSTGEILCRHLFEVPPMLTSVVPTIPVPLATLVQAMLGKEKQQRPSMSQVVTALEALTAQPHPAATGLAVTLPGAATEAEPALSRSERLSTRGQASRPARLRTSTRQRLATATAAAVVTLVAILGAYVLLTPPDQPAHPRIVITTRAAH